MLHQFLIYTEALRISHNELTKILNAFCKKMVCLYYNFRKPFRNTTRKENKLRKTTKQLENVK